MQCSKIFCLFKKCAANENVIFSILNIKVINSTDSIRTQHLSNRFRKYPDETSQTVCDVSFTFVVGHVSL